VWWCRPAIPDKWRLRQEDYKFEASQGDTVSKKITKKYSLIFLLAELPPLKKIYSTR
jgi:hypothetical protein